jgi:hypothetical protein
LLLIFHDIGFESLDVGIGKSGFFCTVEESADGKEVVLNVKELWFASFVGDHNGPTEVGVEFVKTAKNSKGWVMFGEAATIGELSNTRVAGFGKDVYRWWGAFGFHLGCVTRSDLVNRLIQGLNLQGSLMSHLVL